MSLEIHVNASSTCIPSPKPVLTGSSKETHGELRWHTLYSLFSPL